MSLFIVLSHFSRIWLCETLWTAACQASLSMGFSRQEYWSGLPHPPPGHLPNSGLEPASVTPNLHWQVGCFFFTTSTIWEAHSLLSDYHIQAALQTLSHLILSTILQDRIIILFYRWNNLKQLIKSPKVMSPVNDRPATRAQLALKPLLCCETHACRQAPICLPARPPSHPPIQLAIYHPSIPSPEHLCEVRQFSATSSFCDTQ